MTVVLRPATPHDLPAILAIEQSSAAAAHWSADQYSKLVEKGVVWVAENSGQLCGFICAQVIAGEWEIENVAVVPKSARCGIGSQLLQKLIAEASAARASAILLEVRESNLPARRLYEKHGFIQEGCRPEYYREPVESALLYALRFPRS